MTDLISLDCYKDYKGIKSTEGDGKIQALITQVSSLVEHYCNRKFTDYSSTPKVEWHDAKTNSVELVEFPVISVSSVKTSEDGGVTQTVLTEAASDKSGYFVDLTTGEIFTQQTTNLFLTSYDIPYRSLEIEYLAGYAQDELPGDLQLCIQDMVDYYKDEQRTPTKSLLGATLDNPQPYAANSWPPHIRRILDLYRYSP
jgi:hypothetical protein